MKFAPRRVVLPLTVLASAWGTIGLHAQTALPQDAPTPSPAPAASPMPTGLRLRSSMELAETLSPAQRREGPTFLEGDRLQGRTDLDTVVEGHAVMRKADTVIHADRLEYDQSTDKAQATGHVRVNRSGNVYTGPYLELKVEKFEGFFDQPQYQFLQNNAHGEAERADFLDEDHTVVHRATYTTCKRRPGPDWMPDWILRADAITLDNEEEVGVADGAYLSFMNVPLLPVPAISFPLTGKRKSGFLPFTFGIDSVNGTEVVAPYYWNIAPNRDATITPTAMTQRGVDVGVEFRYLEPSYNGVVRSNYMAGDTLRDNDRWGLAWTHMGTLNTGVAEIGNVALVSNINRVSDDNYWRDFTRSSPTLTQRLLPADVQMNWARGSVSASAHLLQWQTLQDPSAPITPPYDRIPQLTLRQARNNVQGFDWSIEGDFTQFEARRDLTLQPNAQRSYAWAQISRPWIAPEGYITPKLQLHASSYQFDAALASGGQSAYSAVPTISIDSGLVLEREASMGGVDYVQTLEPRAFYVYTPWRDQSLLPNYDTGATDFNFASIYTENSFVGHDKIADNHMLTLGLTSRFLHPETGAQLARFGLAQRLRFEDQHVTLNSGSASEAAGISDILMGASVNLSPQWALDSTLQYNPKTDLSTRSVVGARYNPGNYRVINAAYRFQRDASEQVDVSWQWPIPRFFGANDGDASSGRFYTVGRMNYSLDEQRLVDTVYGFEYDAGCWIGRIVLSRTQTSTTTSTQRLMFLLEFVGFTRLGIDTYTTLTQNIARYQNLGASQKTNSRFSQYD